MVKNSEYAWVIKLFKNVPLFISLVTNLLLVWVAILTLENASRPVVQVADTYFEKSENDALVVRFINNGKTPTDLSFRLEMLTVNKIDKANNTSGTVMNKIILYPNASIRLPWPTFGMSNLGDNFKYDYILKIVWEYNSIYPEWIPGIANYSDIRYYKFNGTSETNFWRNLQYPNLNEYEGLFNLNQ